ncbi:MAG: SEC-C domain-containing protein [Epulopiscium sp.]|jgi:uncharacterized protein YecA (UPF0149 family)|nr:SEC-C domain-containing protein [Candidatus Epulonipiscium sp.]
MSLYKDWENSIETIGTKEERNKYIQNYLEKEKEVYEKILENKTQNIEGKLKDLAKEYGMTPVEFTGFIDGINTSITQEVNLEELTEDSDVKLNIDYEKLYWNMLDSQAEWLYTIPAWDDILSQERRAEIKKEYNRSKIIVKPKKIGRNEPCPCGSGKKYKKCCINKDTR